MGHPLLLCGSALEGCGLSSTENLAQFLGAGTQSREVFVLVGCLGLVIFLCIIYLGFIFLWNLNHACFHCNRFGTRRDRRCKYLPVSSELRRGDVNSWGGGGQGPREGSGRMEEGPCLPWPGDGRGARFGGGGFKLSSWVDFWGLVHSHLIKGTCPRRVSPMSSWASLDLPGLPRASQLSQVQLRRGLHFS